MLNEITNNDIFSAIANNKNQKKQSQLISESNVMNFNEVLNSTQKSISEITNATEINTFNSLLNLQTNHSDTKSIPQIAEDLAENISWLENSFGKFFNMMDIDNNEEFSFQLNGTGGVNVSSQSSKRAKVVQMLQDNQSMTSHYAIAAAQASLINAYNTNLAFKAEFDNDPRKAIIDNIDLLKDKLLTGKMTYKDRKLQPVFE